VIHEIRNRLAVAMANVEAFQDGVLVPTPERLGTVLQVLGEVAVLLREFPPIDGEPPSDPELSSMGTVAEGSL
jgi:hypothetical protein